MSNRAWVTLATNDSYGLGALVLAHSLRRAGSVYPAVVLITPSVTEAMRNRLSAVFGEVITVDVLDSQDATHLALLQRPELGITFTKIHIWSLTQYEKCVFLDADTLIIQNCDELFEREELSAAPDVGWPDCFNSGVFVFTPSADTYSRLITFAQERGSFDGGDQGLLNAFFSDWAHGDINKHLPFLYNVTSAAFYSYIPALKQFGKDLKIIHFIGPAKPWLQQFNWESRSVDAPEHLRELVQQWWDLFVAQVHSQLDTAMVCDFIVVSIPTFCGLYSTTTSRPSKMIHFPISLRFEHYNMFSTHSQQDSDITEEPPVEVEEAPPTMPPEDIQHHYEPKLDSQSEFPWHHPDAQPQESEFQTQKLDTSQFYDPWQNYKGNIPPEKMSTSHSTDNGREETKYAWHYQQPAQGYYQYFNDQVQQNTWQNFEHSHQEQQSKHEQTHSQQTHYEHATHYGEDHSHQDYSHENNQQHCPEQSYEHHQQYHQEHQYHQHNTEQSHAEHKHDNVEHEQPQYHHDHRHDHTEYPQQSHPIHSHSSHLHLEEPDHINIDNLQTHKDQYYDQGQKQFELHVVTVNNSQNHYEPRSDHQDHEQKHWNTQTTQQHRVQHIYRVHMDERKKTRRHRREICIHTAKTSEEMMNGDVSDTDSEDQEYIIPRHPYDGFYMRHRATIDPRGRKICTHEIPPTPSPSPPPESPPSLTSSSPSPSEEFLSTSECEDQSGVAGNLARVVPGETGYQREALDELTRRQGWEAGNIDYMGADSFDNIWAKISQTLSQPRTSPPKEPSPPKQPSPPKEQQSEIPAAVETPITPEAAVPTTISVPAEVPLEATAPVATSKTEAAPPQVDTPLTEAAPEQVQAPVTEVAPAQVVAPITGTTPTQVEAPIIEPALPQVDASVSDATPAQVEAPTIDAKSTEVKAPVTEAPPAQVTAPIVETAPVQVTTPPTGAAPAQPEVPVVDEASAQVKAPVTETGPAQVEAPVTESVPAQVETPVTEAVPAQAEAPVTEAVLAQVEAPVTEAVPAQVEAVVKEAVPAQVEAPVTELAPAQVEAPKSEAAPAPTEAPKPADATILKTVEEVLTKESAPVVETAVSQAPTEEAIQKTEPVVPPTPPATPKSTPESSTPVSETPPQLEATSEAPKATESAPVAPVSPAPAPEVPASPVALEPVVTPEKVLESSTATAASTDSPPLANTPSKEGAPAVPAAKSEERRKPAGKLQLSPPAAADPVPITPDSELEDAAALAQSIIASELSTTVSSPSPSADPASPSPPVQAKRLSVEEPQVPTPPVSLAQIGVKPKGKSTTAAQIESSVSEKTEAAAPASPTTPSEPSTPTEAPKDAPKKKVLKKVVKKEGSSGDVPSPVPPPRKKEKKPKEK